MDSISALQLSRFGEFQSPFLFNFERLMRSLLTVTHLRLLVTVCKSATSMTYPFIETGLFSLETITRKRESKAVPIKPIKWP